MTIETSNITSGPYTGNGITASFSYTFRVDDKNELQVFETTDTGVISTLVVDVDYTVNDIGTDGGGTIDRIAGPLPTDYILYIRSNRDQLQQTDFESQGSFFPDVHERAFDKLTFLVQQLYDITDRSFRLADSDPDGGVVNLTLPAVADRVNRILTFDENGDIDVAALIGTFRGDWVTGTVYSARDLYVDPATNNLYFVQSDHTSTTVAADLASGFTELLIDAEYVKQQADLAAASEAAAETAQAAAETAQTGAETAQGLSEAARDASIIAQGLSEAARDTAVAAASAASDSANEAGAFLYDFKGRWFGGLASDPLVDLNGDALNAGDAYFNTAVNQTRVYSGSTWGAAFDVVKATQAEAEAGTDDATYMTPLKTAQAISAQVQIIQADVRQTVNTGPVDSNGRADFIAAGTGLEAVSTDLDSTSLNVAFGDGFTSTGKRDLCAVVNTNLSWGSLVDNDINYLYVEYDEGTEVLSVGSTILAPVYSQAKPTSPATGQYWYPIDHRSRGEVWDGSAWQPALLVFVGQAETSAGSVVDAVSYAYQGQYVSGVFNGGAGMITSLSDNIGVDQPLKEVFVAGKRTIDSVYIANIQSFTGAYALNPNSGDSGDKNTTVVRSYSGGIFIGGNAVAASDCVTKVKRSF